MYVYLCLVEKDDVPYLVESENSVSAGDLVEFKSGNSLIVGMVKATAYTIKGDDEYTIMGCLHEICPATKIWGLSWAGKPSEEPAV